MQRFKHSRTLIKTPRHPIYYQSGISRLSGWFNFGSDKLRWVPEEWQLMISGVSKDFISGWYPAVGFSRNVCFQRFFKFFTLWPLFTNIWLIVRYIRQIYMNILLKSIRCLIELWSIFSWYPFIIPLISDWYPWYPVYKFPAICYHLWVSSYLRLRLGRKFRYLRLSWFGVG